MWLCYDCMTFSTSLLLVTWNLSSILPGMGHLSSPLSLFESHSSSPGWRFLVLLSLVIQVSTFMGLMCERDTVDTGQAPKLTYYKLLCLTLFS